MTPSDTDRFVSPLAEADERQIEGALRPRQLTPRAAPIRMSTLPWRCGPPCACWGGHDP